VFVLAMLPWPSSNVTLWFVPPLLHVHVTVPPLVTEPFDGSNKLFDTVTPSVGPGGGGGAGGGGGGGGGGGDPVLLPLQATTPRIAAITNKRANRIEVSKERK